MTLLDGYEAFPDLTWHLFTQRQARLALEEAGLGAKGGALIDGWTVRPGRRVVRYAMWRAVRPA